MALYFLPTIISSGTVNGGIRQRLLENFLWCCLNLGCEIKDILLIDNGCQDWFIS